MYREIFIIIEDPQGISNEKLVVSYTNIGV